MNQPHPPSSLWQLKPWWCQPWSIILTGLLIPIVAWWLTHQWWIVVPLVLGIILWWGVFLYWVPRQYQHLLQSQSDPAEFQ